MENEEPGFFPGINKLVEKQSPEVEVKESATATKRVYGTLGQRIIAGLIDACIVGIPLLFINALLAAGDGMRGRSAGLDLLYTVVYTLYYGLTESSDKKASVGKRAMFLKVIDERGNRLTFKKAALRYLAKIISIIPLGFGIWAIDGDKKGQSWHDMLMGTYVIREKN